MDLCFYFLLNGICHLLVTGDVGFVMVTWHGPVVPYSSSLNSGKSLNFSFLTHFISPKSGLPNSYINFVFPHSSFNMLTLERI